MSNAEYGPLACLIGEWKGDKGFDVSPESDGVEENLYEDSICFEPIGEVVNAESQRLMVLNYRQKVFRIRDGKRIHDECGYWMWDKSSGEVFHSLLIPRGVSVVSECVLEQGDGAVKFMVDVDQHETKGGIDQTGFMMSRARTLKFERELSVTGDVLSYKQLTLLDIYDKTFEHTDESTLKRVG